MSCVIHTLDETTLSHAVDTLCTLDDDLGRVVARLGTPPLWARPPGFATLIHIILEQQVSLASAKAAFDRLLAHTGPFTPHAFLQLDDETLLQIGFSRQKRAYARGLARAIVNGELDPDAFHRMEDSAVRAALTALKGIGPWTANIYLLMALQRADIWPVGDLALAVAVQEVKQLPQRPTPDELEALAAPWRPWRAAAARILWHHYLSR